MSIGASGSDIVWKNGEFMRSEDGKVPLQTHALHYGTGVFEGIRVYDGVDNLTVFRHRDHYERFDQSAKLLGATLPYQPEELMEATRELIRRNGLENSYVRPTAYWGEGSLGLNPTDSELEVAILAVPVSSHRETKRAERGQTAYVPYWRRTHSSMLPSAAKINGGYVNLMLAERDANAVERDWAILLDNNGDVAEASGANLFMVQDDVLVTPGPDASILDGITRRTILTLAKENDITTEVRRVSVDELYTADEIFVCGTASEVTPIRLINDHEIGEGRAGPTTSHLQDLYYATVFGENEKHKDWLDPVEPSE